MIELDEHLRRLAAGVDLPGSTPEEDLARGRARLRHRNLGSAGAAVATAVVIVAGMAVLHGGGRREPVSGFLATVPTPSAVSPSTSPTTPAASDPAAVGPGDLLKPMSALDAERVRVALEGYRDILRGDLDPAGTRIQTSRVTSVQNGDHSLGTKLDWNHGGMLEIAVGRSLEGVQFFCDGACTHRSVPGTTRALVLSQTTDKVSVAVFQNDGDIVALTADISFGNNGTSARSLGLTVDQLLTAAADPRLNLPDQVPQGAMPQSFFK